MNEDLVPHILALVILFDDVIYRGDGAGHEKCKYESHNVMATCPNVDVDGVEDGEQGETPTNAIDDDFLASRGELIDHGSSQQKVNKRPDYERIRRWGEVCDFAVTINPIGTRDGVDVRAEKEEIDHNVGELEQDAVLPRWFSHDTQ